MSLRKKLSIILPIGCFGIAVTLCVLLYREWTTPDMIEPPLKKLHWGMTLDEAYAVLDEVGIEKVAQQGTDNFRRECELWTLTPEQADLLGYTYPGELALSENEYWPVYVGFANANSGGIIRLVSVSVMVEVTEEEAQTSLQKKQCVWSSLEKEYGERIIPESGYWRIGPESYPFLQAAITQRAGPREMILSYDGSLYLSAQFGGAFGGVEGDFSPIANY